MSTKHFIWTQTEEFTRLFLDILSTLKTWLMFKLSLIWDLEQDVGFKW